MFCLPIGSQGEPFGGLAAWLVDPLLVRVRLHARGGRMSRIPNTLSSETCTSKPQKVHYYGSNWNISTSTIGITSTMNLQVAARNPVCLRMPLPLLQIIRQGEGQRIPRWRKIDGDVALDASFSDELQHAHLHCRLSGGALFF